MRTEGKTPVAKYLFIKIEIGFESSCLKKLRIFVGMLLSSDDLDVEKDPITLMTLSTVVGVRNIESGLQFLRNLEKWCEVGGMFFRMSSAIEVK